MGKTLNAYASFSATDIKARATLPSQSNMSVGSTYVDACNMTTAAIKGVVGGSSNAISTLSSSASVNCWSNWSPREFTVSNGCAVSTLRPYSEGNYLGYNHTAPAPVPPSATLQYTCDGGSITASVVMKIKLGEYDWSRLGATHAKIIIYYPSSSTIYSQSSLVALSTNNGDWITFSNVSITVAKTSVYTTTYPAYIFLTTSDGNEVARIDIAGGVTISVEAALKSNIQVYICGNFRTFCKTADAVCSGVIYQTHRYTGIGSCPNYLSLSCVVYDVVRASDSAVVTSCTYTSFSASESPQYLDAYAVNDTETFQGVWNINCRPFPSTGQYMNVKMYYE